MSARSLICLALAVAGAIGCTRGQAPKARLAGEIASLVGVAGIVTGVALSGESSAGKPMVLGFAIGTALGMGTYMVGELTDPGETPVEEHRRWAQTLTDQAAVAAREGKCGDVRKLERKVAGYDATIHDMVFMRDPGILHCLDAL
jgi:hypothetical protein